MEKKVVLLLVGLSLAALAGCRQAVDTAVPPKIVYGQDVCDRCNMIITEERFAAAYWTTGGEAYRFDDIGGMFAYYQETAASVASFWVHDYLSGDWLRADDAFFVMDPGMTTPMGFGLAACATEDQARALAHGRASAQVLDFDTLLAGLDSGALTLNPMRHMHGEEGAHNGMKQMGHEQ